MTQGTIITLIILIVLVIFSIVFLIRKKKKGSCSYSCSTCSLNCDKRKE